MSQPRVRPRVTADIAQHHHMFDGYPPESYYMRRGTWVGACCDILAMGKQLSEATIEFGSILRIKPLARHDETAAEERWIHHVYNYRDLIESAPFRKIFKRCISVQEEVVNEVWDFCGHPDQIWELVDGGEAIIDVKSSLIAPKFTPIQTAFYDLGKELRERRRRFAILCAYTPAKLVEFRNNRDYDRARILAQSYHVAREILR